MAAVTNPPAAQAVQAATAAVQVQVQATQAATAAAAQVQATRAATAAAAGRAIPAVLPLPGATEEAVRRAAEEEAAGAAAVADAGSLYIKWETV